MTSTGIQSLIITRIVIETPEAKTFFLKYEDGTEPEYQPGQFLTLVFYTKHGEKRRSYSMSSSPAMDEHLCITVKRVINGEFSRLLLSKAKEGDRLFTSGVSGLFSLPEKLNNTPQYFFLAAGSGITPCFSMIKTILKKSSSKVVLIYSNRTENDTIFFSSLKELEKSYPDNFRMRFLYSDLFDVYQSRLSKWLLEQLLKEYLAVPAHLVKFYLCGPFEYMQMITITLLQHVPKENIFKENFSTLPRVVTVRPPDTDAHQVKIHLKGKTTVLNVQYPQTILAAAKSAGLQIPYSCEAGRCGSCAALCTKGKVWMAYNEVLMDDEIKKGLVLTCQGYAVDGDVELRV